MTEDEAKLLKGLIALYPLLVETSLAAYQRGERDLSGHIGTASEAIEVLEKELMDRDAGVTV